MKHRPATHIPARLKTFAPPARIRFAGIRPFGECSIPSRALTTLRKVLGVCATDACRACRPGDRGQACRWVAHPALRRTSRLKNDTALTAHCAVRRARLRYLRVQMVYLISSLQIRQAWGHQSSKYSAKLSDVGNGLRAHRRDGGRSATTAERV